MRTSLAIGLLLLGCGDAERTLPHPVSGTPDVSRLDGALLEEVTLENETRLAHCVVPNSSFEIPSGATQRLTLSTGVREPFPAGVHFEIRWDDAAVPIFSATSGSPGAAWKDHLVDPGESRGGKLRFSVTSADPLAASGKSRSACWGSLVLLGERTPGPPNIILVSLDTLGASYLGSFGRQGDPSPRLDAFLRESFSFQRAYVQFANTLTSHRAIFTSRYPNRHRDDSALTLAELLASHGYLTAGITENAYVGSAYGFARGFDRYVDGTGDPSTSVRGDAAGTFENATRWLETTARDSRFFLFVHTYEVHSPYQPSTPEAAALANRITPDDDRSFDGQELAEAIIRHNRGVASLAEEDIRRLSALHTGEVLQLDAVVGRFLDDLERLGLEDDTVVIVTSDHGEAFGEDGMLGHGKSLHGRVLHVPLGFRWPERIARGTSDAVVQSVDLLPTVLALTGIPLPPGVDGRDLSPLLLADTAGLEILPAFAEMKARATPGPSNAGSPACVGGGHAVFSEKFKLFACRSPAYERLYDLETDPDETRDVSNAYPLELERHRSLLRGYTENAQSSPTASKAQRREVDARTRERLRALGYFD